MGGVGLVNSAPDHQGTSHYNINYITLTREYPSDRIFRKESEVDIYESCY